MKIEEAVKRIEQMGEYERFIDEPISKVSVLNTIRQINQPKPVVPKFVADWYEEHKDNFYLNLHRLAWELIENLDEDDFVPKKALDSDFKRWYHKTETAIQTLINMHQFGYTVQKEKLYTVEIPTLRGKQEGFKKLMIIRGSQGSDNIDLAFVDNPDSVLCRFTEQEIRKDFDWAWEQGFAKEVTE
ncbi:DUF1642 domain-containing protein [Streptococcus uberis]